MKKTGFVLKYKRPIKQDKNFVSQKGYPHASTLMEAWIDSKEELNDYCAVNHLKQQVVVVEVEITYDIASDKLNIVVA